MKTKTIWAAFRTAILICAALAILLQKNSFNTTGTILFAALMILTVTLIWVNWFRQYKIFKSS